MATDAAMVSAPSILRSLSTIDTSRSRPRLVEPGTRVGDALGVTRVTAALELAELLQAPGGRAVQYSINVFAPGTVDLHVIRGMAPASEQPPR